MAEKQLDEVEILIRARYPILYIVSWEEARVVDTLVKIGRRSEKKVYEWSCSGGIVPAGTSVQATRMRNAGSKDPLVALNEVVEQVESAIYIFKDFHPFLCGTNFSVIRKLRDIAQNLKSSYKTLVLVAPFLQIPPELEKDVTVIDYLLPDQQDLGELLDGVIDEVRDHPKIEVALDAAGREELVKAALGLTLFEAENVFAKVLVSKGRLSSEDVQAIFTEKRQIIRKSGLLDYCEPDTDFNHIGGLGQLKDWLRKRKLAFSDRARAFGLPTPRGVLLLGVQGCGKSLCAKAVSALWQLPLLRFDIGRMFSSPLGSSEENVRRAIRIAEGVAPCVLWVDEIDKAFAAVTSSSTDSGASQRVLGTFLIWLSEKTSSVFVAATANNISSLPPELLRKGRFDEIFFVDLPSRAERRDIFAIHITRRGRDVASFDLETLAAAASGLSGAEIEESVITALFEAYYENRDVTTEDILRAIRETVPLSTTMEESVTELREWCRTRSRYATHLEEGEVSGSGAEAKLTEQAL